VYESAHPFLKGVDNMIAPYKQYKRGQRIQNIEERFNSGMQYSEIPLKEGFLKNLVNFNIWDEGEVLRPREGIQMYSRGSAVMPAGSNILNNKICYEPEDTTCVQTVVGTVSEPITGTELNKGSLNLLTTYISDDEGGNLVTVKSEDVPDFYSFKYPGAQNLNGFPLMAENYTIKSVGTFAFANNYYTFKNVETLCKSAFNGDHYVFSDLVPKSLSPKEAVSWGYNMLSSNPYAFTSRISGIGGVNLLGILPYDDTGKIVTTPKANVSYNFKCYFDAPANVKYKIIWESKSLIESTFTTIQVSDNYTFGTALAENVDPLLLRHSSATSDLVLQVSCYRYNGETLATIPEQVMVVSITMDPAAQGANANVTPKTYSIPKCTGMTYWKNRLVCYGIPEDTTMAFFSDVNDPTYFPYPNNAEVFDEPIMYMTPFLENLIVFTSTKIYLLTLAASGLSWTKKMIQGNLKITPWETNFIQVVKNMVFFKSGNYFYMVVPKVASLTGELTIAPVSKPIIDLLDNFTTEVPAILKEVYNYRGTLYLTNFYNCLDFEDIRNTFVFKTESGLLLNFVLLYDTASRSWRIHLYESQHLVQIFRPDATKRGAYISYYTSFDKQALQFMKPILNNSEDLYVKDNETQGTAPTKFANVQYLDTGFRDHSSDFKKRYRELQFKINNRSLAQLHFFTSFIIDGEERKSYNKYKVTHVTEPTDVHYGELIIERDLIEPKTIPSSTLLGTSTVSTTGDGSNVYADYSHWLLDVSKFPESSLWKIRLPVSGKGYAPRIKLINNDMKPFELLNMSYVYRAMNSR
jgi:hypothetical protein